MTKKLLLVFMFFSALGTAKAFACDDCQRRPPSFSITAKGQYGLSGIANHSIQFGKNGTRFDFVRNGGQKVTYPYSRFALEFTLFQDHLFELVYQPIYIDTNVVLSQDTVFDDKTFASGSSLDTRYYFPFYRLSYFYKVVNNDEFMFGVGAGLQLRNATIWFSSPDGSKRFATTSLGPVPLLALRTSWSITDRWSVSAEAAGWWSPIPVLNGGSEPVTGWIYDGAIDAGYRFNKYVRLFLEARLIGGGAQGDSGASPGRTDGYNYNNLNVVNVSTGFSFTFPG